MRQYVLSQFTNSVDREKANFELVNKIMSRNQKGLTSGSAPIGKSQSNQITESDDDFFKANRTAALSIQDMKLSNVEKLVQEMIMSPNQIWSNLGIAYDITRSNKVNGIFGNQ